MMVAFFETRPSFFSFWEFTTNASHSLFGLILSKIVITLLENYKCDETIIYNFVFLHYSERISEGKIILLSNKKLNLKL